MGNTGRTRRPNLTSTHYQGADGKWHGRVWMGTKPDGTADRRHVQRRTEGEVIKAVRALERKRDAGLAGKPGRTPTVDKLFRTALETTLPLKGLAPRTIDGYASLYKIWVGPHLGKNRVDRLQPDSIEELYAAMKKAGKADAYVRKVHAVLSSVLKIAVRRGWVARNPAGLVDPPGVGQVEYALLARDDARKVLQAAARRRNAARWSVGLACGLRQGEALGLRWRYVDLDAGVARVWYQLQRTTWRHGCDDVAECTRGKHRRPCPKNCPKAARKTGRRHTCVRADDPDARFCPKECADHARTCPERTGGGLVLREVKERRRKTIPLASELVELLRAHREIQDLEKMAAGDGWRDHDLVFARPDGRPVDPRDDWEEWADLVASAGLPHVKVHAMRHSAATLALEQGVAIEVVQELLGHSDIRVTRGYQHVASPLAEDAAKRMGKALWSN